MSTYVIGDVQGCYDPLMRLLEKLAFDPKVDRLWFCGDLVNRGPHSLAVLSQLYAWRDRVTCVLGNHDFALLAVAAGVADFQAHRHTIGDVLASAEGPRLLTWMNTWPLAHFDPESQVLMVHAGILPGWTLSDILGFSEEISGVLKSPSRHTLLETLYGDEPNIWSETLSGPERWRFVVNVLTRMRFCTPAGRLDFSAKESVQQAPPGYRPWFTLATLPQGVSRLLFGHWAALRGKTGCQNILALDTGCVWGGCLSAYVLEEARWVRVDCPRA